MKNPKKVKNYKKIFYSRVVTSGLFILLQIAWLIFIYFTFLFGVEYVNLGVRILAVFFLIYIVNKKTEKIEYKTSWIILILLFPMFGVPFYFFYGDKKPGRRFLKRLRNTSDLYKKYRKIDSKLLDEMAEESPSTVLTSGYIVNDGGFPLHKNTEVTYYEQGEKLYASMLESLKKAEKFIFMEYFTIERANLWDEILEILVEKAKAGVKVRLLYDDVGCAVYLPKNYMKQLNELDPNIECMKFNRIVPVFSMMMNNRDHRKMMIIDGDVGFTGGINLSDRYINIDSPYGHWKDAGVRLRGDAVWNMTLIYLEMWDAISKKEDLTEEEVRNYMPSDYGVPKYPDGGYVQPYADQPFDDIPMSENVYLSMISTSKEKIYIYTPYLILSDELSNALCLSAMQGKDVRIVVPGIPDKKMVYRLTRSSYPVLLRAGVKVYEYTPGFIHSKCMMIDGKCASVGTVNFDYRSLFLHFEDSVYFSENQAVKELEKDMLRTFDKCKEIKIEDTHKTALGIAVDSALRLIAPIL